MAKLATEGASAEPPDAAPATANEQIASGSYTPSRHLAALSEISQVLVTAVGFEEAIDHVIATVARALSIESGGILLVDHETEELVLQTPAFGKMNEPIAGPTRISLTSRSNSAAVFKSGRPYMSNDAPNDPAILQSFVDAYSTRNILTVPLQIAGRSIGVFHAVNKVKGGFNNDDADFLSLIAPHLAIIVRSSEMMRTLRTQHRELERVLEIERTLSRAFLAGNDLAELTETLARLLQTPVALTDEVGLLLTAAGLEESLGQDILTSLCHALSAGADRDPARSAPTDHLKLSLAQPAGEAQAVVFPILVRGDRLGYLAALATHGALGDIQIRALRQAVALFAVEITKDNEGYEIRKRLQIEVMDSLFAATSHAEATRLFRQLAPHLQFPLRAGFLKPAPTVRGEAGHDNVSRQVRLHHALRRVLTQTYETAEIVPYREGFVLLIPSPTPPDVRLESERLSLSLSALDDATGAQRVSYQAGIGASVSVATDIIRSFEEALAVVAIDAEHGGHNSPLLVEQLDIYRLFLSPTRKQDMDSYVETVLGKLVSYDRDRGAGLMEFLHALVEVNFNTSRVARVLSIHLNTAKYRRHRIEELLEVGLDDPDVRFSVQLALKLLAIHDLLERRGNVRSHDVAGRSAGSPGSHART
jgi:sugar diacid utilization regulator